MASSRGCEHHVMAVEIEKVRAGRKESYADALRKVRGLVEPTRPVIASATSSLSMVKDTTRQIMEKQSFTDS